jgi:hypothetical protein
MFNANSDDGSIQVTNTSGLPTVRVVEDPDGVTSRGSVMRITHYAGEYAMGCQWKCRFSPDNTNKTGSKRYDDVYMSFDVYYDTINKTPFQWQVAHKGMRLITGTMLEAGHLTGEAAIPEGILAFNSGLVLYNNDSYGRAPEPISCNYTYDADVTHEVAFLNTSDPEEDIDTYDSANAGKYHQMTQGVWHNVVLRWVGNTADSNEAYNPAADLKDGLSEIWIDGQKVLSRCHRWRWIDDMLCDGFWLQEYFNVRTSTPAPTVDHYVYYDNFKASTTAPNTAPNPGRVIPC